MFDPDNIKRFDNHNYYEIKTGNCTNAKKNIQTTHNVRQSQIETETTKIRETKNWPMFEPDNIKTSGNHNYYEIKTGNCTNAKKNIQTTHNFRQSKIETK